MVWFSSPGGRLGNQLFQYAFLQTVRRNGDHVFAPLFRKFKDQFRLAPGYLSVDGRWSVKLFDLVLDPLVYWCFVQTRLVSSWVDRDQILIHKKGLFSGFVYVLGYYQNESWWKAGGGVSRALIPGHWFQKAANLLGQVPQGRVPAFLHIRRTDYLNFNILGVRDACLPTDYYRASVERIRKACPKAYFLVVGDDPTFAETELEWLKDKIVSREAPVTDLAAMASCSYGILSNSTLAWWGGYWMENRKLVVAPEYWLGFKSKTCYPKHIIPDWAEVLPLCQWYKEK